MENTFVIKCKIHPEKVAIKYCKKCKYFICRECSFEKHETHNSALQSFIMPQNPKEDILKLKDLSVSHLSNINSISFQCMNQVFHQAKDYCKDCKNFICKNCINKHDKSHKIISVSELINQSSEIIEEIILEKIINRINKEEKKEIKEEDKKKIKIEVNDIDYEKYINQINDYILKLTELKNSMINIFEKRKKFAKDYISNLYEGIEKKIEEEKKKNTSNENETNLPLSNEEYKELLAQLIILHSNINFEKDIKKIIQYYIDFEVLIEESYPILISKNDQKEERTQIKNENCNINDINKAINEINNKLLESIDKEVNNLLNNNELKKINEDIIESQNKYNQNISSLLKITNEKINEEMEKISIPINTQNDNNNLETKVQIKEIIKEVPKEVIKEIIKEVPVETKKMFKDNDLILVKLDENISFIGNKKENSNNQKGNEIIKEVIKEVPKEVIVEKIVEVPKEVIKEVIKEVPKEVFVEKIVEVPKEIIVEKIVEVPKKTNENEGEPKQIIVEKIVEVPKEVIVEKIVSKEVEKLISKKQYSNSELSKTNTILIINSSYNKINQATITPTNNNNNNNNKNNDNNNENVTSKSSKQLNEHIKINNNYKTSYSLNIPKIEELYTENNIDEIDNQPIDISDNEEENEIPIDKNCINLLDDETIKKLKDELPNTIKSIKEQLNEKKDINEIMKGIPWNQRNLLELIALGQNNQKFYVFNPFIGKVEVFELDNNFTFPLFNTYINVLPYIYLSGGKEENKDLNSFYALKREGEKKLEITILPHMNEKRSNHSMIYIDSKKIIVVISGSKASCEKYNFSNKEWEYLPSLSKPRERPGCALINDYLYIFFGFERLKSRYLFDIEKININDFEKWEIISHKIKPSLMKKQAVGILNYKNNENNDVILITGGVNSLRNECSDSLNFNIENNNISKISTPLPNNSSFINMEFIRLFDDNYYNINGNYELIKFDQKEERFS